MIINNRFISSIESLKTNFDFIEIWNKRDIAIRDLSPHYMYYSSAEKEIFYKVFAHPEYVNNIEGCLVYHHDCEDIALELDMDNILLRKYSYLEQIQIQALHKLVDLPISESVSDAIVDVVSVGSSEIVLENGRSLKIGKKYNKNNQLEFKPIFVPESSKKQSKVGDYSLGPGQVTYGVFSENVLVDVVPPYATNSSYHLEYELIDDKISLIVTDNATNNQVARYDNAHYFALLGDRDFIVINGLIVSCFTNEDLNNRLRNIIVKAKFPEIIIIESEYIRVIYKDFSEELIQI